MMKKTYAMVFVMFILVFSTLFTGCGSSVFTDITAAEKKSEIRQTDLFEKAVTIIKKYETLHQPKHWPLVGYGHKVLPSEKFSRSRALSEKEADALLRKDLKKLCAIYRSYGKDSILLATLAYNIGHGAVNRSSIVSKLKAGDRNIHDTYISYCRYRGKEHAQIKRRRIEEFENLYAGSELAQAEPAPLFLQPFVDGDEPAPVFMDWLADAIVNDEKQLSNTESELSKDPTL